MLANKRDESLFVCLLSLACVSSLIDLLLVASPSSYVSDSVRDGVRLPQQTIQMMMTLSPLSLSLISSLPACASVI